MTSPLGVEVQFGVVVFAACVVQLVAVDRVADEWYVVLFLPSVAFWFPFECIVLVAAVVRHSSLVAIDPFVDHEIVDKGVALARKVVVVDTLSVVERKDFS